MNQEIKDRDEKYSELDSKFTRLHKRAKQRIQEVQKVKCVVTIHFLASTVFASSFSLFGIECFSNSLIF